MKISAMPDSSGGTPGVDLGNVHIGATASAAKLAAAKAIAQGLEPQEKEVPVQAELPQSIRKITMRTNVSPNRYDNTASQETTAEETPNSTISDEGGQTQAAVESTQPLSPQFAALAKQRRALQVKERELAEREAKVANPSPGDGYVAVSDLLSNPLKIFDLGMTHDQLTEAILANESGFNPELKSLKEELKRVKEDVTKTLTDRDIQAEKQVLAEMRREAEGLVREGDAYEMIRETKSLPHVIDLIHRTYKMTGEVLSVQEALNLVETDLITETLKVVNIKKVKSKLAPETEVQFQPQSQGKQMKTLTNRDGASMPMDRKARAIAAMQGTLRR